MKILLYFILISVLVACSYKEEAGIIPVRHNGSISIEDRDFKFFYFSYENVNEKSEFSSLIVYPTDASKPNLVRRSKENYDLIFQDPNDPFPVQFDNIVQVHLNQDIDIVGEDWQQEVEGFESISQFLEWKLSKSNGLGPKGGSL